MNHQPYEDWLFGDEPLTPDQAAGLQAHLRACPACQQKATAWQALVFDLRDPPLASPAPGFTQRWTERLEADRHRLHRRQTAIALAYSLGAAALIFSSLLILALPVFQSPQTILWTYLARLVSLLSLANTTTGLLGSLFRSVTQTTPLVFWVLFAGLLTEMAVLWLVSYRVLINPRRVPS